MLCHPGDLFRKEILRLGPKTLFLSDTKKVRFEEKRRGEASVPEVHGSRIIILSHNNDRLTYTAKQQRSRKKTV